MPPIHIDEIPIEIKEFFNKIISISFPRQGYTSNLAIIESDQGFFALKRTKGKLFNSMLKKEVSILNTLNNKTELPVPKVKKFIEKYNNSESWALLNFIEGETIRMALFNEYRSEKRQEIIFSFGEILSEIHSTPCPDELVMKQPWLDQMLFEAEYNSNNYSVDGTKELLERIKVKKPKEYKQTLIHGDFTIDNVMISNGVITGVIDWGSGAYGDPRYDVSLAIRPKPNAFENEIDKQIFFEGYGGRIIDEDEYEYFANGLYEFF
ncbi:phosphotransferase family protein [Virgibacillus pantothenticus]|uniref:phosphotransferase family protein n=1 Tax=Virgibacillus pantothenticus TaxID=1473 RepID=UPI00098531D8|nr:phosphotransferase [Virgibacillus pantothenticus]